MDATTFVPWTWLMSKHSMRSGALGRLERLLQLAERQRPGGEIGGALELVLVERLLALRRDGLGERPLVAALRYPDAHPRAAPLAEPLGQRAGVVGQHGHEHLARDLRAVVLEEAVELGDELLDEIAGAHLVELVDDPAALAPDPPAANVEHLHRGLEVVLGEGDDVGVGAVAEHDSLLLHRPAQRFQVVAHPGRSSNSRFALASPIRRSRRGSSCRSCRP